MNNYRNTTIIAFCLLHIVLALTLSSCDKLFTEFWVSPKGSDSNGTGTINNPWRSITYALDHVNYNASPPPMIRLKKGIYEETFSITKDIRIWGAGVAPVAVWPDDPLIPTQEVSMIKRPQGKDGIRVSNGADVRFGNLVISGGNLRASNADLYLTNVEVRDVKGLYGIQLEDVPKFQFLGTSVKSDLFFADYAIEIINSSGTINDLYAGKLFDHVINIIPSTPISEVSQMEVIIEDSQIEGSSINYADGIRIQGPVAVKIINTTIQRAAGSEPAGSSAAWNPPYAGIEVAGWTQASGPTVVIDGVSTSGFDTGIGVNIEGYHLKVQNSTISGITYGVRTNFHGYTNVTWPFVDFGAGILGSAGNNTFLNTGQWAFYHPGPYHVPACGNAWSVQKSLIDPNRIYDRLDNNLYGRVSWDCIVLGESAANIYFPPTPTTDFSSVSILRDTPCYAGPGPEYTFVTTLTEDQNPRLVGLGVVSSWYVVQYPGYPRLRCWVSEKDVEYVGNPADLALIPIPTPRVTSEAAENKVPDPEACSNRVQYAGDTIPDNSGFAPETPFTKSWTLINSGSCTWTTDYTLVFFDGTSMAGSNIALHKEVQPSDNIVLSMNLIAPSNEGSYQGWWMLQDESGDFFGLGDEADAPFWVLIQVEAQEQSPDNPPPSPSGGSDTQVPVINSLTFSPGSPTSDDLITFNVTASDNVGVARIDIYFNLQGGGRDQPVKSCSNSTTCNFTGGPYAGGQYIYFAYAFDAAGNYIQSFTQPVQVYTIVK